MSAGAGAGPSAPLVGAGGGLPAAGEAPGLGGGAPVAGKTVPERLAGLLPGLGTLLAPATRPGAGGGGGTAPAGSPLPVAVTGPGGGASWGLPLLPGSIGVPQTEGAGPGLGAGTGVSSGGEKSVPGPGGLYVDVAGSFDLPMGITGSDYQTDAEGMRNLLAEVRARTKVYVTVQERFVPLQTAALSNIPLLHLRGHRAFSFSPEEREALRQYVARGGLIVAEDSHGPFSECLRREMQKIFGRAPEDLPRDHEIYRAFYVLDDIPAGDMGERYPLQGIDMGGRPGVIFSANDYGDCWEGTGAWVKPEGREPAFKMGVNIFIYAVARWQQAQRKP